MNTDEVLHITSQWPNLQTNFEKVHNLIQPSIKNCNEQKCKAMNQLRCYGLEMEKTLLAKIMLSLQ